MSHRTIPPAFAAGSLDELEMAVRTQLGARLLEADVPADGVAASARRVQAASSDLWYCDYGTLVELAFPESDYVRVQIPLGGAAITEVDRAAYLVAEDAACVSRAAASIRFQPDFTQIVWRVPRSAITRKLAALTGSPVSADLEFRPVLDLSTGQGRLMRELAGSFAGAARLPSAAMLCAELEQAMITVLLDGTASNHRFLFDSPPSSAAPRQVKIVESHIEAHWDQTLDYETLAAVSGTSVRSLFRAFKTFRGYTPMDFAKTTRLRHAMELLIQPDRSDSVTAIAARCGYTSLSAFSRDFTKAYGTPPSAARDRG